MSMCLAFLAFSDAKHTVTQGKGLRWTKRETNLAITKVKNNPAPLK